MTVFVQFLGSQGDSASCTNEDAKMYPQDEEGKSMNVVQRLVMTLMAALSPYVWLEGSGGDSGQTINLKTDSAPSRQLDPGWQHPDTHGLWLRYGLGYGGHVSVMFLALQYSRTLVVPETRHSRHEYDSVHAPVRSHCPLGGGISKAILKFTTSAVSFVDFQTRFGNRRLKFLMNSSAFLVRHTSPKDRVQRALQLSTALPILP
ncbi:hypothetical protein B0T10DRAFT_462802 [Thelonectria olida]|uniref:Uncharacterized protein n=1 Tax=Thelonectria olida TaxID=1576542 RepID=A0A9P9AM77_9HYPO|nr:hypothetical protein B0T10DRAFT_462802 [Thelonectria olida]